MRSVRRIFMHIAIVGGAFLPALACGGSEPRPAQPTQTTAEPATAASAMTPSNPNTSTQAPNMPGANPGSMGGDSTGVGTGSTGTAADMNARSGTSSTSRDALTDDQILQVTHVANMGEVEQGKIAQQKAKDPRVKRFAAMMVKDHSDADMKGTELASRTSLSPSESSTSTMLKSDSDASVQRLKQGTGDFDRAYIDAQVNAHRTVLDTIDNKLLPNAKNSELRSMLQTVRAKVEGHLKQAQDIQSSLGSK
ncbi:DUF4142 domain-containing protein [Pendulispora brunnea]|uniref:DUF4142 domain-containing protein n=1 Tax=Pendulispora brunnea TaxID=2905690 RepID=A0ABZ2KD85_9BACT